MTHPALGGRSKCIHSHIPEWIGVFLGARPHCTKTQIYLLNLGKTGSFMEEILFVFPFLMSSSCSASAIGYLITEFPDGQMALLVAKVANRNC